MVPYKAIVLITGDVLIEIKGTAYYDELDIYSELDNSDIVEESKVRTVVTGEMTPEQYRKLIKGIENEEN